MDVFSTAKLREALEEPPTHEPKSRSSSRKPKSSSSSSSSAAAAADATSSVNIEKIRRKLGQARAESPEPDIYEFVEEHMDELVSRYGEHFDEDDIQGYMEHLKKEKSKMTLSTDVAREIREKIKKRMKYIKTVKLVTRDANGKFIPNPEAKKRLDEIEQIRKILNNINDPHGYQSNDPIWDAYGLQVEKKELKIKLEKVMKKIITLPCNNTIPKAFLKPYKDSESDSDDKGKQVRDKIKPLYITLGSNKQTIYTRLYDHLYNLLVPIFNRHINAIYSNVTYGVYEYTFGWLNEDLRKKLLANRYTESEATEIIKQYNNISYQEQKSYYFRDNIFPYLNIDGKFGDAVKTAINIKGTFGSTTLYLIIRDNFMRNTINSKILYNILDLEEKAVREKVFKLFESFEDINKCYEVYETFLGTLQRPYSSYIYRNEGRDSYYDILSFKDAYTTVSLPRKRVAEAWEVEVYKFIKTKPGTYLDTLAIIFKDIKKFLSGRNDKSAMTFVNLEYNYYNMQKICDEMLKYLNNFAHKDTPDAKIIEIKGKIATIQELLKYCATMLGKIDFNGKIYNMNHVGYDQLITDINQYLTTTIGAFIQNKQDVLSSISDHEFILPIDPSNIGIIYTAVHTEYNKYFVNDQNQQKLKVPQLVMAEKYKYSDKIPDLGKDEYEIKFIDIVFDHFTRVRLNSIPTLLTILLSIQALFNCMIEIRNDYYTTDDVKQLYPCIKTLRDYRTQLQRIFDNENTPQAIKPLITSVIDYVNEYIAIIGSDIRLAKFTERESVIPDPAAKRFKEERVGAGNRIKKRISKKVSVK